MAAREVVFGDTARGRIIAGATVLANAVRSTLGPKGRHVVLAYAGSGTGTILTRDGATVARDIELPDKLQNMGAQLLREAASQTGSDAGDGTTTAIVLAHAMAREGTRYLAAGCNPAGLKRGISHAAAALDAALTELALPLQGARDIARVAAIAANGDARIGAIIADALERVGKDGAVTVEDGNGREHELAAVEGLRLPRGYLSPYFINRQDRQVTELEQPFILLADKKLTTLRELLPVLELVAQSGRPLLVIAQDVESEALSAMVINHMRGLLSSAAVQAPGIGAQRSAILEDIAALTGGRVIAGHDSLALDGTQLHDLGQARRVEIGKDYTVIVGGAGTAAAVAERSALLKRQLDNAGNEHDAAWLRQRLASLAGGVAVIRAGGATELELRENKARIDDALHATRAAEEEGIVAGGGVALLRARQLAGGMHCGDPDRDAGIRIVLRAVEEPLRQIAANAGAEPTVVLARVLQGAGNFGYNAADGSHGDLLEAGVIDPVKVTRSALRNAASVAIVLLSLDASVHRLPLPPPPPDHHHDDHH